MNKYVHYLWEQDTGNHLKIQDYENDYVNCDIYPCEGNSTIINNYIFNTCYDNENT